MEIRERLYSLSLFLMWGEIDVNEYNNEFLNAIKYIVKGFMNAASFDRTVRGIVIAKGIKYTVLINGNEYSADCFTGVGAQINDVVYVLVPQNDWDSLVIVSKKEK